MTQTTLQAEVAMRETQADSTTRSIKVKPDNKIKLLRRSWFWCVLLPFLLCSCYFGLIASDRYVGEAKVIVKQADNNGKGEFGFALLGAALSSGSKDAQLVRQFILSYLRA